MIIDPREVFPKAEIHNVVTRRGSEYSYLWKKYFDLITDLANWEGNYTSELDEVQCPSARTCDICMTVHNTNERGSVPSLCVNAECQEHREFWSYEKRLTRPGRAIGYHTRITSSEHPLKARSAWFKKQMSETFGSTSLFSLPEEMRLSTLATMTLLRMSIEARAEHDKRIASALIRSDGRAEVISDHQGAGESNRPNGAHPAETGVH